MGSRRRWVSWALVAALGLTIISVSDADGFRRYFRLRRDMAALEERNRALQETNGALVKEISGLRSDPRAMEQAAREELGFVKPGELVINLEAQ